MNHDAWHRRIGRAGGRRWRGDSRAIRPHAHQRRAPPRQNRDPRPERTPKTGSEAAGSREGPRCWRGMGGSNSDLEVVSAFQPCAADSAADGIRANRSGTGTRPPVHPEVVGYPFWVGLICPRSPYWVVGDCPLRALAWGCNRAVRTPPPPVPHPGNALSAAACANSAFLQPPTWMLNPNLEPDHTLKLTRFLPRSHWQS